MQTLAIGIDTPDFWTEKFENSPEPREAGAEKCVVCGKKVLKGNGFDVQAGLGGGDLLPAADTSQIDDAGYLGWWAIGATCARRIPAEYKQPRV